jgi:hypothetical protein
MSLWAERGDTAFTHSNSLLGAAIRWGETDPDEKGTNGAWANHMLVVVESGWIIPPDDLPNPQLAVIVEAMWHVQKVEWWTEHKKEYEKGQRIRVFRPIPAYTEEEKSRFVAFANHGIGERYGWWKLLGFLAKRLTGIDVPKLFFIKDRPICSFYAAYTNEEARKRGTYVYGMNNHVDLWPGFGMLPQEADPDEAMDFCEEKIWQFWQEVK